MNAVGSRFQPALQPDDQVPPGCHRWENLSAGRYYEARVVRDLFGDWQVMRVWGGIGSCRGALRFAPLAEPGAFAAVLARIDKRRAQRGYVLRP